MNKPENSLQFLGAAETVTGSRFLIETAGKRILVDCGLFQGYKNLRLRNWHPFPVAPYSIDVILLTHAHLDHSGYVPALVREGFKGEILVTAGTAALVKILWPDSAYLLEEEAERANRKGYTKHKPAKPLYDQHDVERALKRMRIVKFGETVELPGGASAEFVPAGHILGAAQIRVTVAGTTVHFTGDLGREDDPLMIPPAAYEGSDILVTESTYGDRNHPKVDPEEELGPPLKRVLERGGTVVIPAFAVGRSQALLLHIWRLMNTGAIPRVPIYLNSPMARATTRSYEGFPEEHRVSAQEFDEMYSFANMVNSVEESKVLNQNRQAKVIIAASGMMTGGRVLHHIVAFGSDPNNAIILTGYQAGGTRGRKLQEGAETLRIFGFDVPILAEVINTESLSAHVDSDGLINWMQAAPKHPKMVYAVHGEPASSDQLRFRIENELGWRARAAVDAEVIDLDNPR